MLQAARAIVVAAAAVIAPLQGGWTPVEKWIEQRPATATDWFAETYVVFETDYDVNQAMWVYRQRGVTLWEYLATEIPPRSEYDEEP